MRIEQLVLERYGHFTDHVLDFSAPEVRLSIVCGSNEAGKTTALNAIGDLLFGIDARSSYAFLHGYADMRIGGTITARGGAALAFKRRKGHKNTLIAAHGRPLGDEALQPFLGMADRALFARLFGLTQSSLASGAAAMLDAGGDVGQVLFEAGGNVRRLVAVLRGLDEEAAQLFTPRRSGSRLFYTKLDVYKKAQGDIRVLSITSDDWTRIAADLATAESELTSTRQALARLEAERAKAERIRRLLPRLRELEARQAELSGLADAADLPAGAGERVARAQEVIRLADAAAGREERAAAEAERELAGLDLPKALLARAEDIRRLHERRGAILKAAADLPNRQAERHQLARQLDRLARDLGTGLDGSQAFAALPAETVRASLRRLITEASALETEQRAARARVADAEAELGRLQALVAADGAELPQAALAALRRGHADVLAKGDLAAACTAAHQAARAASERLGQALSRLPGWHGDAAALAGLAVPDQATLTRFEADLATAEETVRRLRERRGEAVDAALRCERELAELSAQGDLPTADALAQARARRDRGWRLIRRRHVDGAEVADAEVQAFAADTGLVEAYERAVAAADHVADRRTGEAERLARHAAATAALNEASARRVRLDRELADAQAEQAATFERWTALWAAQGVHAPGSPREMAAWLAERRSVLGAYEAWQEAARHAAAADAACAAAGQLLRQLAAPLQLALGAGDTLASLSVRIAAFLDAATRDAEDRRQRAARARDHQAALERERQHLAEAQARAATWAASWRSCTAAAGLGGSCDIAAAEKALALWEEVRNLGVRLTDLDERITGIDADMVAFAADVRRLAADAGRDLDGTDAVGTALALFTHLQAAEAARTRSEQLGKDRELALKRAASEHRRGDEARSQLHHFMALAGYADAEGLGVAVQRSERKAELRQRIEGLEAEILAAADGLALSEAAAEAEGCDADALKGRLAAISGEVATLMETAERSSAKAQELRSRRDALSGGEGAAAHAQAMADARADLEATARRWMLLRTAAFILRGGIERFRALHQGPLLDAGGAIFRTLTRGSFAGFSIAYDERDEAKLTGLRPDGSVVAIEAMSDGTRDQLFLALRIAAIESYAAEAEPLPFIADDLFVNFDDARAAAGIDALIGLGAGTQVLLFTHHRHLAELARDRPGVRIIDLERP
jgi:uncharacterized protein YhaN